MTENSDEPRTATEKQVDFAIGVIVGAAILGGVFFLFRGVRRELLELLGLWWLVLGFFMMLGCGYLNYRLGAALWSRK